MKKQLPLLNDFKLDRPFYGIRMLSLVWNFFLMKNQPESVDGAYEKSLIFAMQRKYLRKKESILKITYQIVSSYILNLKNINIGNEKMQYFKKHFLPHKKYVSSISLPSKHFVILFALHI